MTPDVLVFGTGGIAAVNVTTRASCTLGALTSACDLVGLGGGDGDVSKSTVKIGWTLGGGVDANIGDGWFARTEYRYTDAGSVDFSPQFVDPVFGPVTFDSSISLKYQEVNFGVGMRF